ncbi:hypothetical protein LB523_12330 [Mesorhizobium sp. ESP-6-4]|uniref:hypothetical protein n=1 Tax=Mesorhizobium sp. ESP-6-4 TaxID=2876624 RepID=UPI001CC9204A|nr:hypothetical protein [Mesorhizobium sp. ESP-6-4]MBZ9659834.1 hypothetical protein [Mesorhizobium sp. ESP-6-4]
MTNPADIERIERELRARIEAYPASYSSEARKLDRALLGELSRLRSQIEGRDQFIVNNGLWSEFVAALPARAFMERTDG